MGLRRVRPSVGIGARQAEWSVIASADDLVPAPSPWLVDFGLRAADAARQVELERIEALLPLDEDRVFVHTWPGEHYRLLTALGDVLHAELAVEIGTYRGLGSLALAQSCARVISYDVLDVTQIPGGVFARVDPREHNIDLRQGDLARPEYFAEQADVLSEAQLIFCDGPKDGRFEQRFVPELLPILAASGAVLVLDDIRTLPMIQLWRDLAIPKLDLTSFGHWSGTGLASFA